MKKEKGKLAKIFEPKSLPDTKPMSKKKSAIILTSFSVIMVVVAIIGFLYLRKELSDKEAFKEFVSKHYVAGALILIVISALQVIIALVPGELVEIAAGYAFGAWEGALYCLIGVTIGSVVAILLSRKFGRKLVEAFFSREKIDALPIIREPKKRNFLLFILFFMSGTPKDMFAYIIGLTNMSIPLFLLLTTFARFPSIIISTYVGEKLLEDNFLTAAWTFGIMAVISIVCLIFYSLLQKKTSEKV